MREAFSVCASARLFARGGQSTKRHGRCPGGPGFVRAKSNGQEWNLTAGRLARGRDKARSSRRGRTVFRFVPDNGTEVP